MSNVKLLIEILRKNSRCCLCLKNEHVFKNCTLGYICRKCDGKHHYGDRAGSYLINIFQIYKHISNRKKLYFKTRFISKASSYILESAKYYFKSITIKSTNLFLKSKCIFQTFKIIIQLDFNFSNLQ